MTLVDHRDAIILTTVPAGPLDHPAIADFLATTEGLGGRKFASASRDVAEHLAGAYPDGVTVVRDAAGTVRGYALLRPPRDDEAAADFVFGR